MDCNKEEAFRAKDFAESKMQSNDFSLAKKLAQKAQRLYPELENINQLLAVCEVHCAAKEKVNGETDWYGILQVDAKAEGIVIKKQYRKLAFLLHPDKNKFPGTEAAFKLIAEAHMILSDQTKRVFYDSKRNGLHKATETKLQPKPKSEPAKTSVTSNVNGRKQQQPSALSTFWTMCPKCRAKYNYNAAVLRKAIRCQCCHSPFIANEINLVPSNPFGPGVPPKAQQQVHSQPAAQSHFAPRNTSVKAGTSTKDTAGAQLDTATGNVAAKHGAAEAKQAEDKKESMSSRDNASPNESQNCCAADNTPRRSPRVRQDVTYNEKRKKVDSPNIGDPLCNKRQKTDANSSAQSGGKRLSENDATCVSKARCGSASGKKGTDGEGNAPKSKCAVDADKDWTGNKENSKNVKMKTSGEIGPEKNASVPKEKCRKTSGTKCTSGDSNVSLSEFAADAAKDGKANEQNMKNDQVHASAEIGTEKNASVVGSYSYSDPEFYDFEVCRDASRILVNQIWALYDNLDGMPRFYARIRHIQSVPHFKIRYTWLEFDPDPASKAEQDWSEEELPVGCGNFVLGKSDTTDDMLIFSHVVSWSKGQKRNSFQVLPSKGEVWALYKDWNIQWSADAENHKNFSYEIVEVISDFTTKSGCTVIPLVKVAGYVSLFAQARDKTPFVVRTSDLLRFSHNILRYRTVGNEKPGVPEGCLELDTASLPGNLDVSFPSISIDCCLTGPERLGGDNINSTLGGGHNLKKPVAENSTSPKSQPGFKSGGASRQDHSDTKIGSINSSRGEFNESRSSSRLSPSAVYSYPDSEFFDFEQLRAADKFQRGQIWALYSDLDKFPKFYAWISKVEVPFAVHVLWLEACPQSSEEKRLLGLEIPVGCGHFKVANWRAKYESNEIFSHIVTAEAVGKKYYISPCVGEIWAIYRNWKVGWEPSEFVKGEYYIVEVLELSSAQAKVSILTQDDGCRCVFRRKSKEVMAIRMAEYIRFSHRIPAHMLTDENGGKLRGCWELDPASVPEAFLRKDTT